MDAPELQPEQSCRVEVQTPKRSCLNLFSDGVKNISPTNFIGYRCKAFFNPAKARTAASTAESYMFTLGHASISA